MNFYDKLYLVILVMGLLGGCSSNNLQEKTVEVQVRLANRINQIDYQECKGTCYSLNIDLINNTDSVFYFWEMTCSWQDNWLFNSDKIHLVNLGCDSNFPIIRSLESRQKASYTGIVCVSDTMGFRADGNIRIGFIHIKKHEVINSGDFNRVLKDKLNSLKDMIWSEPIAMNAN